MKIYVWALLYFVAASIINTWSKRVNYASGCTSVGDLDGDGKEEIVVAGSTYPAGGSSVDDVQYEAVHIFKKDR